MMRNCGSYLLISLLFYASLALAGVDGSISGTAVDSDGVALSGVNVQLQSSDGKILKEAKTDMTGNFNFFPVEFGTYGVSIQSSGLQEFKGTATVTSGQAVHIDAKLIRPSGSKE